ncbi:MAG: hypothetical protein ACFFD2_00230 [Promethearchaeota archaeon]
MSNKNDLITNNGTINKSGIRNIIRSILYVILHTLIFFIAAGSINLLRGWIYYDLYFCNTILNLIIVAKLDPELLNQRGKMQEGTKF